MKQYLEELKSHPYISENISLNIYEQPFKHIVIDNLLKPEIYQKISNKFPELVSRRSAPHGQVGTNSDNVYEAIIYGLAPEDAIEGFEFFIDPLWKNWLSNIFNTIFNEHTAYSIHFHKGSKEKPSKSGWVHQDLSICSAINDPSKDVKIVNDCDYADDSNDNPHTNKIIRSVANLFYVNNIENPSEEDGGGTGIYTSYDKNDYVKSILPTNNRLFAFEVSPISYHAFIGANFNRSAIVQWFHSNPSYYVHKHLEKFKSQFIENERIFEEWKQNNPWSIEQDTEYSKYFDRPFREILSS
jgi:hypothetical protein